MLGPAIKVSPILDQ